MLWIILYTLLLLADFYFVYRYIFDVQLITDKVLYIKVLTAICLVQLGIFESLGTTGCEVAAFVCTWAAALILTDGRKKMAFLLFPAAVLLVSAVNLLGVLGLATLMGLSTDMVCNHISLMCVAECTGMLVFGAYGLFNGRKHSEQGLSLQQYIALLLGVCGLFGMVIFSQALLPSYELPTHLRAGLAVAAVALAIMFMAMCFWQQATWKRACDYRRNNEKYALFLEGQEAHIRTLIKEDERRRRLRHDMNAHMKALDSFVQQEDWEALRQYVTEMQKSLGQEQSSRYTSISAVDAIIDEWYQKAKAQNIEWSWEGQIGELCGISVFELCVVFSNLLSNAVEAIERTKEPGKISVRLNTFQEKLVIEVGNTCGKDVKSETIKQGSKKDNFSHGLGHKNVEEVVNKQGGYVKYTVDNGWFTVTIIM